MITALSRKRKELFSTYSKICIVVENAFSDIKDWRCCKDDVCDSTQNINAVLERHHQKWLVCSYLKNKYNRRGDDNV